MRAGPKGINQNAKARVCASGTAYRVLSTGYQVLSTDYLVRSSCGTCATNLQRRLHCSGRCARGEIPNLTGHAGGTKIQKQVVLRAVTAHVTHLDLHALVRGHTRGPAQAQRLRASAAWE